MTTDNSSTSGAYRMPNKRSNRYAQQLRSYVEDRALEAARMIHETALAASAGCFAARAQPARYRVRNGVATTAAVSILMAGSPRR
jgi:hypothetical protein